MNPVQINQILGHFLMIVVYVLPPILFTVVGTMQQHEDPALLWMLIAAVYLIGHLISCGAIR